MADQALVLDTVDAIVAAFNRAPDRTTKQLADRASELGLDHFALSIAPDRSHFIVSYLSREASRVDFFTGKYFPDAPKKNEFQTGSKTYKGVAATEKVVAAITLRNPVKPSPSR